MTHKERIRAAFEHREGDRVPIFEQSVASDVASEILGREAFTGTTYLHYQEAVAWMRGKEDKVLGISWLSLADWPFEATRQGLRGFLDDALLDNDAFMRWMTSLGLKCEDGTNKPGYDAFRDELARYRRDA